MAEANEPDPRKFFQKLVCEHDSKVKLNHQDIEMIFLFRGRPEDYFRRHPQYFIVFENDEGRAEMVGARLRNMQLCVPYSTRARASCNDVNCSKLHLCRDFVGGHCNNGANCSRSHTLQIPSNKRVLAALYLLNVESQYPEDKLLNLLRMSTPQVCGWYNNRGCPNDDACTRFHVCRQYVRDRCVNTDCDKAHTYDSPHSGRLLEAYELENKTEAERKTALLIHKGMSKINVDPDLDQGLAGLRLFDNLIPGNDNNDWFGQFTRRNLQQRIKEQHPVPPQREQTNLAELGADHLNLAELEMLQAALGEDDLSEFLANQQLVENQVQVLAELEATKAEPRKADDTEVRNQNTIEDEPAAEAGTHLVRPRIARPVRRYPLVVMPTYSGEAPQGDQSYICQESVHGKCPKDGNTCEDMHFVSEYLWQIGVGDRWYNLDTVNNEIEQASKNRQQDYLTQVPREVEGDAGQLMRIAFRPKITGEILRAEATDNVKVKVRRLGTRTAMNKSTLHGDRRHRMMPIPEPPRVRRHGRGVTGAHFAKLLEAVGGGRKLAEVKDTGSPAVGGITTVSGPRIDIFQWEVHVGDRWLPLVNANKEIEQSYQDKNEEYITMLPGPGDSQFIAVTFATNTAHVIGETDESTNQMQYDVRRLATTSADSDKNTHQVTVTNLPQLKPRTVQLVPDLSNGSKGHGLGGDETAAGCTPGDIRDRDEHVAETNPDPPRCQDVRKLRLHSKTKAQEQDDIARKVEKNDTIKNITGDGMEGDLKVDEDYDDIIDTSFLDDLGDEDENDEEPIKQELVWQWQWRNEQRKWESYHQVVSDCIEKHSREDRGRLKVDNVIWIIDYLAGTQTNKSTGKICQIRRVPRR